MKKKDKRHESPNAIMVKILLSFINKDDRLILVSMDKGFKKAIDEQSNDKDLENFEKLEKLLDYVSKNDKEYGGLDEGYEYDDIKIVNFKVLPNCL